MAPVNKSSTSSGKLSTLRKLFTKPRARPSLPIQHPQETSGNSSISNVSSTKVSQSSLNQDPELQDSDQIQKNATLTLRTIESLLLLSEELDALTSQRQALESLATKYKVALVKVQKRRVTSDRQEMRAEDEQRFLRVLENLTEAERHASEVTWKLLSLLGRTVGSDVMLDAERDRKNETRAVVYLLLRLRLDQEYGSPAPNAQKQLFKKVAELCTQFVNKHKPYGQDDAPNNVTPTEDTAKDDAPSEDTAENDAPTKDTAKDDAPNGDTLKQNALMGDVPDHDGLNHDAQYDNAPKHAGENILVVAGRFISLEFNPLTADALGDNEKQILAEIKKLCIDFHTVKENVGKTELDDSYQASEDIRCLAESINKRLVDILARIEMKSANQRQELIRLVNLNLNYWFEECRKDVRKVEERESLDFIGVAARLHRGSKGDWTSDTAGLTGNARIG